MPQDCAFENFCPTCKGVKEKLIKQSKETIMEIVLEQKLGQVKSVMSVRQIAKQSNQPASIFSLPTG